MGSACTLGSDKRKKSGGAQLLSAGSASGNSGTAHARTPAGATTPRRYSYCSSPPAAAAGGGLTCGLLSTPLREPSPARQAQTGERMQNRGDGTIPTCKAAQPVQLQRNNFQQQRRQQP